MKFVSKYTIFAVLFICKMSAFFSGLNVLKQLHKVLWLEVSIAQSIQDIGPDNISGPYYPNRAV